MANQPSLETVTSAFNSWRKNRPGRTGKTPVALQQQVHELLPFHSPSEIRQALKISGTMLKTWQQSKESIPEDLAQPVSDVLPNNNPTVIADYIRSFCDAHDRRQFVDILSHFLEQVEYFVYSKTDTQNCSELASSTTQITWAGQSQAAFFYQAGQPSGIVSGRRYANMCAT